MSSVPCPCWCHEDKMFRHADGRKCCDAPVACSEPWWPVGYRATPEVRAAEEQKNRAASAMLDRLDTRIQIGPLDV